MTNVNQNMPYGPLPPTNFDRFLFSSLSAQTGDAMPTTASSSGQVKMRRRGLRKGTHSCWECKRRKMRCIFPPTADSANCQGCRRRGTPCISQEVPEEVAMDAITKTKGRTSTRANQTDSMSGSPMNNAPSIEDTPMNHHPPTPAWTVSQTDSAAPSALNSVSMPPSGSMFERLSYFLHTSLPSLEDRKTIYQAKPPPAVAAHELMTMPYTSLLQNDSERIASPIENPDPTWHPVLIARHMLMLASSLQHLHPDVHPEVKSLSEPPAAMAERLAGLANHCVTSKDEMLGSVETLECIMIESVYQANLGNLRRSWVSARRALNVAQLMGLDRSDRSAQYEILDRKRTHHSQVMWSRLVFLDRFLCLMLGLPAGCTDTGMTSEALLQSDLPTGPRLERIHCIVASRILERGGSDPTSHDLHLTHELDLELQRAAKSLPARWWLLPKLDSSTQNDPQALFWNTGRLFAQVLHYNLLNQLHLPYMLRSSPNDRTFEYSRITCVNASREILTRFMALRSINNIPTSCRIVEFITLMAALTLLLTHMDSRASGCRNLLAHQHHSDRAMIEQVQESMEEVNRLTSDPLSARSGDLLRRLLIIDTDHDTDGASEVANMVSVHPEIADARNDNEAIVVSVHIPYFGIIKITRNPSLSLSLRESPSSTNECRRSQISASDALSIRCDQDQTPYTNTAATTTAQPQSEDYPGLAAGIDDWAFQGVDLAFFNNIMKSTENNDGISGLASNNDDNNTDPCA